METFKMELVGWFSELCSAAFGTGDKKRDHDGCVAGEFLSCAHLEAEGQLSPPLRWVLGIHCCLPFIFL